MGCETEKWAEEYQGQREGLLSCEMVPGEISLQRVSLRDNERATESRESEKIVKGVSGCVLSGALVKPGQVSKRTDGPWPGRPLCSKTMPLRY